MKTFSTQVAVTLLLLSSAHAKWWSGSWFRRGLGNNNGGGNNGGRGRGRGRGNGGGFRGSASTMDVGPLSNEEEKTLLFMREEEKMARDVYKTMFAKYPEGFVFANIAISEQAHMDRMGLMIDRYGLAAPVIDDTIGVFQDAGLKTTFDSLVEKGNISYKDALNVGALIEEIDINDLKNAIDDTDESALDRSYGNLKRASETHLRAFVRELGYLQTTPYKAQNLTQAEVDAIIYN